MILRTNSTYFRVSFRVLDPNVYRRYLALVIVGDGGAAVGLRSGGRSPRHRAVVWLGLRTFSQSSFCPAGGLAVLRLAWNWRWTLPPHLRDRRVLCNCWGLRQGQPPASISTPAAEPIWSPAALTSSANARSRATAPNLSVPSGSRRPARAPVSSPTQNRSRGCGAGGCWRFYTALTAALWTCLLACSPSGHDGTHAARRSQRVRSAHQSAPWPAPASSRIRSRGPARVGAHWRPPPTPRGRPRVGLLRRLATTGAAYTAARSLEKLIAVALPLSRYLTRPTTAPPR